MPTLAAAENWPNWRGPRGDGSSNETDVPVKWNGETGENILWKTPLAGRGHASPIVWNDRLFVTGCVEDSQQRVLYCLNANSGEVVWSQVVLDAPLETKHDLNSFASGTPATDGERVYVSFLEPREGALEVKDVKPGEKKRSR